MTPMEHACFRVVLVLLFCLLALLVGLGVVKLAEMVADEFAELRHPKAKEGHEPNRDF
jgi:hypothetical protein